MSKVAKLVCVSLMVRVVVEENLFTTEEQELDAIAEQVRAKCIEQISNDAIGDHVESIEEDEECPYGTFGGEHEN